MQLSTKRLIRLIIHDLIRFECCNICIYRIVRLYDQLWIRILYEFRFCERRRHCSRSIINQRANIVAKSWVNYREDEKHLRFHEAEINQSTRHSKTLRKSKNRYLIWIRRRRRSMIIHQEHENQTFIQKIKS